MKQLVICVVEDNEDCARMLQLHLEAEGHIVYSVGDVQAGLVMLGTRNVDLLICDITLPDGDGWQLLKVARDRKHDTVGIAMSGFNSDEYKKKSREAGFQFHLGKPFTLDELDGLIEKAIETAG